MVEAVFFDLYETLITEWNNGRKIAEFGSPGKALGIAEDEFIEEWSGRREGRMNGNFADYAAVLIDICQSRNVEVRPEVLETLVEKRLAAKLKPVSDIQPNILSMLKRINETQVKIGLISNCAPEEAGGLFSSRLADLFDDVVLSYQVGVTKSQKEIYLMACERLDVTPSKSVFVGDGGSEEFPGAKNAGLRAYHATWFQPLFISERIKGFPQLKSPDDVICVIQSLDS